MKTKPMSLPNIGNTMRTTPSPSAFGGEKQGLWETSLGFCSVFLSWVILRLMPKQLSSGARTRLEKNWPRD